MNDLKIAIENDIFVSETYNHIVSTTFYIDYRGKCFPDSQWTDFTHPVLDTWVYSLLKHTDLKDVRFKLYLMDGPYRLDVFKDKNMQLTIDCINFREEEYSECTIHCSFIDFLSVLYEAIKTFSYILYNNGLNKGNFVAVYNQSIISMKDLKAVMVKYQDQK